MGALDLNLSLGVQRPTSTLNGSVFRRRLVILGALKGYFFYPF